MPFSASEAWLFAERICSGLHELVLIRAFRGLQHLAFFLAMTPTAKERV